MSTPPPPDNVPAVGGLKDDVVRRETSSVTAQEPKPGNSNAKSNIRATTVLPLPEPTPVAGLSSTVGTVHGTESEADDEMCRYPASSSSQERRMESVAALGVPEPISVTSSSATMVDPHGLADQTNYLQKEKVRSSHISLLR